MRAIRFETTVDENMAGAVPEMRPLLGQRVEVTATTASPSSTAKQSRTLDDFLAHRLKRPADIEPVTLQDMERAIAEGAMGGDV